MKPYFFFNFSGFVFILYIYDNIFLPMTGHLAHLLKFQPLSPFLYSVFTKSTNKRLLLMMMLLLCLVTNGVYLERWDRIDYKRIKFLLADSRYPNLPSFTMCVPRFEQPSNWGDFFGTRLRTYFVPFQSGNHYFFLCKIKHYMYRSKYDNLYCLYPVCQYMCFISFPQFTCMISYNYIRVIYSNWPLPCIHVFSQTFAPI